MIFVFLVYGLAFFSKGLVVWLESGRTSGFRGVRVLRYLAGFGILHGLHEWVEIFTRLDSQIKHLREVKETAERMIQVRLREFNQILSAATGEGYDENGNPAKGPSSFFHDRYV